MPGAALALDMTIKDQFRKAMRGVASAVFLVTTRSPVGDAGMTATAVCSLSLDPVSVLICVNRSTSFIKAIEVSGRFALNVLSRDDEAIAKAFGSAHGRDQRFSQGEWYQLEGLPALRSSLSTIVCKVAGHMDFGSHRIYFGQVNRVENRGGRPELIFCHGEYRSLIPQGLRRCADPVQNAAM
jgi:flavin reductase (DIM6/NTAB) family NADH-FMN oxidoreductase RutF